MCTCVQTCMDVCMRACVCVCVPVCMLPYVVNLFASVIHVGESMCVI